MTPISFRWLAAILCVSLLAASCGDEEEVVAEGVAPVISNLEFDGSDIPVGRQSNIGGSFDFEDEDADISLLQVDLLLPGGQAQGLPQTPLEGVPGKTAGKAVFLLALNPPLPGEYFFEVKVRDDRNHLSEALGGMVRAVEQ